MQPAEILEQESALPLPAEPGAEAWEIRVVGPTLNFAGATSDAGTPAPDPERHAMAEFMVAQTEPEEARPASPDPSTLDAEEAFVEPLPGLERPSLDAARRLLATGRQVEDFVQALLAETPPGGAPAAN